MMLFQEKHPVLCCYAASENNTPVVCPQRAHRIFIGSKHIGVRIASFIQGASSLQHNETINHCSYQAYRDDQLAYMIKYIALRLIIQLYPDSIPRPQSLASHADAGKQRILSVCRKWSPSGCLDLDCFAAKIKLRLFGVVCRTRICIHKVITVAGPCRTKSNTRTGYRHSRIVLVTEQYSLSSDRSSQYPSIAVNNCLLSGP